MKSLFPEYDDSASKNYADIWKNALFVFDTNVLLNLYRYQTSTRDELLNVLGQLSDRIWIPHHVALEFQRNRLTVIAEQNKRFSEVRRTIKKTREGLLSDLDKLQLQKRHSLINPQALTSGFQKLADEFLAGLDRLQESQQKLTAPDPLKQQIETLFDGKVGKPPSDQSKIDELYRQAEVRFKLKIPPGYQDTDKGKDEPDEHIHGGIIYKRKYGDFLVWKQLLEHCESNNTKSIVFVTDDGKEDWWLKVDSDGPKTIGPRPELIKEAREAALVETLLMYNPEGFLKYAKDFLKVRVSEETLKEVRDLSTSRSKRDINFLDYRELAIRAEQAFMFWLESRFEKVHSNRRGFTDFIAEHEGKTYGFEVRMVQNPRMSFNRLKESLYRAYYELKEKDFSEIALVWIVSSPAEGDELRQMLARLTNVAMPDDLRIIIGIFDDSESGGDGFHYYDDFSYNAAGDALYHAVYGDR